MMTRVELLQSLLALNQPLANVLPQLTAFGWDNDRELVILKRHHIAAIFNRYLTNTLAAADVEAWANAIEGREDIGYESGSAEVIAEAIDELANPLLTRSLTKETAKAWLDRLNQPIALPS
jgi:hypothetical protein